MRERGGGEGVVKGDRLGEGVGVDMGKKEGVFNEGVVGWGLGDEEGRVRGEGRVVWGNNEGDDE